MFERIVAGVSRTESARSVAERSVELANALGAHLDLVSTYDDADAGGVPVARHTQSFLDSVAARGKGEVETHCMRGDPVEAILTVADQVDADLIVVGNKGMRGARRVLGSVPNAISHHANCAVLILSTT